MNFDIPRDLNDYLQELDEFIDREIKPMQAENDNERFFDHRREDARGGCLPPRPLGGAEELGRPSIGRDLERIEDPGLMRALPPPPGPSSAGWRWCLRTCRCRRARTAHGHKTSSRWVQPGLCAGAAFLYPGSV